MSDWIAYLSRRHWNRVCLPVHSFCFNCTPKIILQIAGLQEVAVTSGVDMVRCLEQGSASRATGATAMNSRSSRSHAIFTITLEQKELKGWEKKRTIFKLQCYALYWDIVQQSCWINFDILWATFCWLIFELARHRNGQRQRCLIYFNYQTHLSLFWLQMFETDSKLLQFD